MYWFRQGGADVVLASRSVTELEAVAEEIQKIGQRAHVLPTDLVNESAVVALTDRVLQLGGVDILISNAAYSLPPLALSELNMDEWRNTMMINVGATLLMVKQLIADVLTRDNTNIVVISSIKGLGGTPTGDAYGSSKSALN